MLHCTRCCKPSRLRCGKCGVVAYCSKTCQETHWAAHKPNCKAKKKTPDSSVYKELSPSTLVVGGGATPVPQDPGGVLKDLGLERTAVLHQALDAESGSDEQKSLFTKFEEMTTHEWKEWDKRGVYAGAAKAVGMLASGNAQMGRAHKYVKYMAEARNYISKIEDKDERFLLNLFIQTIESNVGKFCKPCDVDVETKMPSNLSEAKKCLPGEVLTTLKKFAGIEQCFLRIIELPPGQAQHLLTGSEFEELKRPVLEDLTLTTSLRRMMVYVNNTEDGKNMKKAVQDLGHLSDIVKFVPVRCSKQHDVPKYLRAVLLRFWRAALPRRRRAGAEALRKWRATTTSPTPPPATGGGAAARPTRPSAAQTQTSAGRGPAAASPQKWSAGEEPLRARRPVVG